MTNQPEESRGLTLLKKGQKGLIHAVFSRFGLILVLFILQVVLLVNLFLVFEEIVPYLLGGRTLFTVGMVLYLLNSRIDPTAKITWLIVVMLAPVVGALFFWYTQSDIGSRAMAARLNKLIADTKDSVKQDAGVKQALEEANPGAASLASYLMNTSGFPVYDKTAVTFYPLGEDKWQAMLRELREAKKFIFMEYFIIDEGIMWGQILEILAKKVKEGVEVRVMYDGTNEFTTLPRSYADQLRKLGISCKVFSRLTPFVSMGYNYRDHRKILVIDGQTAFTGGVNLADEYINRIDKHGHWKDTAVMLKGEAVRSFTLMFLQMWSFDEKTMNIERYVNEPVVPRGDANGFVIPYGDSPLDDNKVGECVYMDILNRAERYVYIMSPYLILDGELELALTFAAKRGVDVRLILPGVPDKKAPYALAKTHYAALIDAGVKIYEYTPGFVHAKVFVSDDREAVVGTINLDYRSLYHHFECAAYMYGVDCIPDILADYNATLNKCREVTPQTIKEEKLSLKLMGVALKAVAPLL